MPLQMKLSPLAQGLALTGLFAQLALAASLAQAQAAPTTKIERVEVTGSSIKRLKDEGALPVQVITADELSRQGIQTAEQMLSQLGINAAGADNATSNNNVFGADTDRLTGGSSNANLRGLGAGSTLVLLNGRRISTHGMSGGAVDLNAIPMAALDRVEILKDGASAIYGTDAIGGVINFILKKNMQSVNLGVDFTKPLADGGGTTRRAAITGGFGDLGKDRFNLLISATLDKNDILRGSDRSWANGFQPELGLSPNSSSSPFANILNGAGTALPAAGSTVGSSADTTKYTRINLLSIQGKCGDVEAGVQFQPQLWNTSQASGRYLCNTDYGKQYMLAPPLEAKNLVARASFALSENHTAFVEFTGSRTEVRAELTPSQFSTTAAAGNFYPVNGPYYLNLKDYGVANFDPTKPISYRWRMQDFGNRVINNISDNQRLLVGLDGELGKYSYKLGLSSAKAEGKSELIDGYAYAAKLNEALKTGKINPWVKPGEKQSAEAMALIESTKARGELMGGKTGLTQFDGALSGELFKLPAGMVEFATGFDLRRETYEFAMSEGGFTCVSSLATTVTTDVLLCPGNSAVPKVSRDVKALYAELAVPVFKGFDLQLALRHDRYSDFGGSTNPKVAFRYLPTESLLLRGSVNTGFKAPSFQQLSPNTSPRDYTGKWSDPTRCPSDPTQCDIIGLDYTDSGNPNLTPEKSKQGTIGLVFSPLKDLTFSADYWRVDLDDRIRKLTINDVLSNYALFPDRFVRDASGNVAQVNAGWINAAGSSTKGVDWSASYLLNTELGKWRADINGTYMISHQERAIETLPLVEYVGQFGTRTIYLRNKFTASLNWSHGDWASTFTGTYKSGYVDQDMAAKGVQPATANKNVDSYAIFGLYGSYSGFKNTKLTLGLRNLFDKQPPFTHHDVDDVVGAGWDPRVADPFGRTFTLSLRYEFK